MSNPVCQTTLAFHSHTLLPGERSSPAHLSSYKAWRASTAAKQIRIEAGPSFIHERSGAQPEVPLTRSLYWQ